MHRRHQLDKPIGDRVRFRRKPRCSDRAGRDTAIVHFDE